MHWSSNVDVADAAASRLRKAGAQFLMIDLDVANLLLDSALMGGDAGYIERALQSARRAHGTMLGLSRQLELTEGQLDEISDALEQLHVRLDMHGV
jgi:hypothetical protein